MDGIFGVGLAEMLIIGLALFIIGGPQNSAKWAREAGRIVRKMRRAWDDMMAEMERELGPDGKEIMDATRELSRGARDMRSMSSPRRLISDTARMLEEPLTSAPARHSAAGSSTSSPSASPASENGAAVTAEEGKYRAWLPPEDK